MNKTKITIWGRDFELDVSMECYPGEIVLDSQKSALEVLLNATDAIENAKTQVEEYVMTNNKESFPDGKMDNIFRYVMPVKIFVPHDKSMVWQRFCAITGSTWNMDWQFYLKMERINQLVHRIRSCEPQQ